MIDLFEVLPILALALAIVLLPLLADKPPEKRGPATPPTKSPPFPERTSLMG